MHRAQIYPDDSELDFLPRLILNCSRRRSTRAKWCAEYKAFGNIVAEGFENTRLDGVPPDSGNIEAAFCKTSYAGG